MNILIVLLGICFLSLLGYIIIRGLDLLPPGNTLLSLGISYGLGVGLVALQLYCYSRVNIAWNREFILVPWLLICGFIVVLHKKRFTLSRIPLPNLSTLEKVLCVGIVLTVLYVFFEVLLRPVGVWDAWATWIFESKVFFIDGKITEIALHSLPVFYPLIFNLLNTYIFILLGKVDDTAVLLVSFAFYVFIGVTFFAVLYKKYGIRYALFFTLLFISTQNLIRHGGRIEVGIADLPLGYYFFISVVLLFEYIQKNTAKLFGLLALFLGFTGLIKNEGLPFVIVIGCIVFYFILKTKTYSHITYLLIPFILLMDWQLFKKIHGLDKLYFAGHVLEFSIEKTKNSFLGVFHELLNVKSWNMLWIIYFYSLSLLRIKIKESVILFIIIFFQLSLYLLLYIFTADNNPESSIERLLIHIAPLACLSITYTFVQLFNSSWLSRLLHIKNNKK